MISNAPIVKCKSIAIEIGRGLLCIERAVSGYAS